MHHRAILLSEDSILVVGGRRSPVTPNSVLYTLSVAGSCGVWKIIKPHDSSDEVEPRWRHSATRFKFHGKLIVSPLVYYDMCLLFSIDLWCVIVFGGLSSSNQTLNDGYIIHTSLDKWKIEKVFKVAMVCTGYRLLVVGVVSTLDSVVVFMACFLLVGKS